MSSQLPDLNSFLTENELFTDKDFKEFLVTFQDKYNEMIRVLNKKDYGSYTTEPVLCGQLRFDRSNAQNEHTVFRKVIDFGALPDTALKQVAHGITFTEIIRMYGVANDTGVDAVPIENPMLFSIDTTNINITTVDNKTAYDVCTVTVEYI